jgi:hypothetical protein
MMASSIELDFRRFTSMAVASAAAVASSIDDSYQLHDVNTILELVTNRAGQLHSERGLPHAPRADQRDQPMIDDHLGDLLQQCLATDQRLHPDADRRPGGDRGQCDTGLTLLDLHHGGHEFVPLSVHRPDDQLLAAIVADGLANRLDPRRQRGLTHEAVTPDGVEQLLLAHHRAAVLDEIGEHVEHLGLDPDLLATPPKDDAIQVQLAVSESDHTTDRSRDRRPSVEQSSSVPVIPADVDGRASDD